MNWETQFFESVKSVKSDVICDKRLGLLRRPVEIAGVAGVAFGVGVDGLTSATAPTLVLSSGGF